MRLMVLHETTYSYAEPAAAVIQHLRMTPRPYEGLFIRKWRIEIDADYRLDRSEDAYGNVLHTFTASGPVHELRIVLNGDVETSDTSGVVRQTLERFPLVFWQRPTALTAACARITEWAADTAAGEGGDTFACLHALNVSLARQMTYAPTVQFTGSTASDALAAKRGSAQDFAHVMVAAARSLNIPARCVSGYYLYPDGQGPETRHAWVEAHVDGVGWLSLDPTIGKAPGDTHIRVACGLDNLDAAPMRGARTGGSAEAMKVLVKVTQGPTIIDG